jgi:hypothetical protein
MRKEYNFSKGNRGPVIKPDPNPDKPEIRNSPDLIKLAEIRNGSTGSPP